MSPAPAVVGENNSNEYEGKIKEKIIEEEKKKEKRERERERERTFKTVKLRSSIRCACNIVSRDMPLASHLPPLPPLLKKCTVLVQL